MSPGNRPKRSHDSLSPSRNITPITAKTRPKMISSFPNGATTKLNGNKRRKMKPGSIPHPTFISTKLSRIEEVAQFDLGGFGGIRTVHGVGAHVRSEIAANRAFRRFG